MNDQQQDQGTNSFENNMAVAMFLVNTWAVSIEVFLHKGIGSRYLGFQAAAVLGLIPIYSLFWERYDIEPLMLFLVAYMFALLARRLSKQQYSGHSFYCGYPRLLTERDNIDELKFKRVHEPIITFLLGVFTLAVSPALGWFWMIGAVALVVKCQVANQFMTARELDLNDAILEQQFLAERMRARRGI